MGGLALSRVRYDRYLKFLPPLLGILLVLTCLFMLLGVAVPSYHRRCRATSASSS